MKGDSPYRWIIDPIDGTMNFVHGLPYYAVSIALAHGSELTHAVVLDPSRDELFTAIKGRGAQLNDATLRKSMLDGLGRQLDNLEVPYFIPKGKDTVALPAIID